MQLSEFDYELPESLIAQNPTSKRDKSKLMVVNRKDKTIDHKEFSNIIDYLEAGDCLVLNDSKVIPARIFGKKTGTGVDVEFLLIKRVENDLWQTMVRPGRRLKKGDRVQFAENFVAEIVDYSDDGTRIVNFEYDGIFMERLEEIGNMPLPPYIERENVLEDKTRYQTVYSKYEGSVAAPTAGLHFTKELLEKIENKGVKIAYVTLHVGIGTFRPVKVDNIKDHSMHFESYNISEKNAEIINNTIRDGGKIVAVGTTTTRTLESGAVLKEDIYEIVPGYNETNIFIYPPYQFKIVDCQITNFHLPKSTLLMLISAFYDKENILNAYEVAKKENYRFFSYGDAMIII